MYEKKQYEDRTCVICGVTFKPGRKNQVTCASPECRKARHAQVAEEWKNTNHDYILAVRRRNREEKRIEENAKPDTIVAIGYADRQIEQTLKMVGRVNTEL